MIVLLFCLAAVSVVGVMLITEVLRPLTILLLALIPTRNTYIARGQLALATADQSSTYQFGQLSLPPPSSLADAPTAMFPGEDEAYFKFESIIPAQRTGLKKIQRLMDEEMEAAVEVLRRWLREE